MTRSTVAGRCHLRQLVMYWLWMPPVAPLWNACAAGAAAGKVRLIQSNAMRWYPLVPSQQVEMLPPTTPVQGQLQGLEGQVGARRKKPS